MTSLAAIAGGGDRDGPAAQAGAWLARLQADDVGEAEMLAFDAWLDAAAGHREAYAAALSVWHEFGAGAEAVGEELARPAARKPAQSLTRRWMAGVGGLAVAATVTLALLPALTTTTATYATGKGQHRQVKLTDGSTVDLNAETRLSVKISLFRRQVALSDGEAIFDVAHDTRRPFTVQADGRMVRVVGTQFDVRNRSGDVTVTVARGKVEVRPSAASDQAFMLTRGQRLQVGRTGRAQLAAVDPSETFSWRAGRLVYRNQPLSEVVADLNRQFVQQIEIGDPALAQTPITGVIVLDDPATVVERLSLMLPIRSVPSERGLLLLRK
ncbi:FecR domain-containing protein [Phenylobacterium sp.]|uniref:FecR family protein n=1 Tax=Phenylobacterium sp. TaxID=1871053 RepID=UPI0025FEB538|nr:FecR domain-containing protein [Phenylobacterium sp.]MBX3485602.1 FecR domain-containing protein [Phenylobacterium sp.]MCW5758163.1 FecR domain-containing protein [Phenylobacterium sp.]